MPTLRIAVRKFDPFESAIRRQLADFARTSGLDARVELEPLELNDLHRRLFENRGLGDGSLDIAFLSTDWLVPRTWEDFHAAARRLHSPQRGCYGTALALFPDGHNGFYDFCIQVWSRGGEPFGDDARPRLRSRAATEALEHARELPAHPRLADIAHAIDDLLAQATGSSAPVDRPLRETQGGIEEIVG